MPPISFKANYIHSVNIPKLQDGEYKSCDVSFVKIDPSSKNDISTLKTVSGMWGEGSYAGSIYHAALGDNLLNIDSEKPTSRDFFALTSQKDSFDKLNPDNVLGMVHVNKYKTNNSVEFLQVNPKYITPQIEHSKFVRFVNKILGVKPSEKCEYKHIGTGILDSLKKLLPDKPISLLSVPEATKFYKKNGFVREYFFNPYILIWKNK